MNLASGVTVSLETVARNLAGGRGAGIAPGVEDEGALATALKRVLSRNVDGGLENARPTPGGHLGVQFRKGVCFSDKYLLLATPLSPCDSHTLRCIFKVSAYVSLTILLLRLPSLSCVFTDQ